MAWVYLVICCAVVFYIVATGNVGRLRGKLGVHAPACVGHPQFERAFRVQQNTLEQLVPFVPMVYLFGLLISPIVAAGLGGLWLIGRILYMYGYLADPAKRSPGMILTLLALIVLTLGVLGQVIVGLAHA
jgi:glutathione S-transferase